MKKTTVTVVTAMLLMMKDSLKFELRARSEVNQDRSNIGTLIIRIKLWGILY